ncbi:glycoside hydrolase family 6 protein [Streptacidiphilus griseoplanus]|uniref:glycoside hydrolase family 6 protein n=1 Tax=Peterkaempfera griseoplana TaxID=66896 RepID=UPI001588E980|nr:glycoside hydrolase family 6 protein [Peterkaempfera griseoplana]
MASALSVAASGGTAQAAAAARVDNPYVGAKVYVNPEWSKNAAAEPGGSAVSNQPTAVWLDRIAAINGVNGGMGLKAHLDAAVAQGATAIQLVIYDLPGRDCSALASNGELGPTDIDKYETQYIDPIASILSSSAYANLRIINIIEPDSLPNLVTNAGGTAGSTDACATMKANGNYEKGVGYALAKLGALGNTYNYIDAGHHGWLGWDSNLGPSVQEFYKAATTSGSTVNNVAGFIVNTANYSATVEPNFKVTDSVNGTTVRQSKWVDWNNYVDEQSYALGLRNQAVSAGFPSSIGMLIDTSRNGWGGTARPTGPGPQTSVDDYVNGGRIDRRIHAGNWCNQSGAGLGERPTAAPVANIDAYVWVKPPGESDGASQAVANDEGKGFDQMCDPTYGGNARNGNNPTGALANAPLAGHWFSAEFQMLLKNAYPPVNGGSTTGGTTAGTTSGTTSGTTAGTTSGTTSGTTTGTTAGTTTGTTSGTTAGTTTGTTAGTTTGTTSGTTAGTTTGTTSGTTTGTTSGTTGGTGAACSVTYTPNSWGNGFTGDVLVKANKALSSWKVTWSWGGNQQITGSWNATVTQSGTSVTATNASYNGTLASGATADFGFQGTYSGTNATPAFTCTGS